MQVGDKVTLVKYPTWGVCVITQLRVDEGQTVYIVRRDETESITMLVGVRTEELVTILPPTGSTHEEQGEPNA